jgi:glycosyltransferase involved in cell wall biosynthesis
MLTVVILTKNEEERVGRAVASLSNAWPVVVIDSFSEDNTLEQVRKSYAGQPEHLALVAQSWRGFVATRNQSLEWVRTEWVLWIDADEWMSPELVREVQALLLKQPSEVIFKIPRRSVFLGRWIRHSGWGRDLKARLARTRDVVWIAGPQGGDVHEDLVPKNPAGRVGVLNGSLEHEPFRSIQEQEDTNRRYSALQAEALAKRYRSTSRRAPSRAWIWIRVAIKFLENYIWKRGFLDGYPGWVVCVGSARSLKWRFEKLREILRLS